MIVPLLPQRVRKMGGSFAFIEHRFLRDGFWASLARDGLINKDLIGFDGRLFQVLSLPEHVLRKEVLRIPEQMAQHDPVTVRRLIERSLCDANRG